MCGHFLALAILSLVRSIRSRRESWFRGVSTIWAYSRLQISFSPIVLRLLLSFAGACEFRAIALEVPLTVGMAETAVDLAE